MVSLCDAQRRELLGLDRDKTPTLSAVSRLENKYSNILERTAAGRRRHEEDRDKTLEPDDYGAGPSGLLRSATTHQMAKAKLSSSSFNAADRKERTPYRTRAQRQRYIADSNDSGYLTSANRLVDESYPLNYSNRYPTDYHDALRAGGATGYPTSRYGRRGTNEETLRTSRACGHTKPELLASDFNNDLTRSSRYANRHREPAPPKELTAEEREILADDRSSEDNAAILLLLREDNQFLEAKKFEERMRKRRELKERVKQQEEATTAQVKKTEEAEAARAAAAVAVAKERAEETAKGEALKEVPKKKSRSKKVTNDSDSCSSSTSESSSSDEAEVPTDVKLTKDKTDTAQHTSPSPVPTFNGTTTSNSNNTNNTNLILPSSLSNLTLHDTETSATSIGSSGANKSRFLLHSARNNNHNSNDLSKYQPGNILHSSSSGALAFGGIGARLAAADTRRQQQRYQGANSRTAAVLSDFERYKPGAGIGPSYLHDSYSTSSRRSNALGSSSVYHRQLLQQPSNYLQQQQPDQYQLSKSATSSALFHRSRIPKTLSTFVSHTRCISMLLQLYSF